MNKDICWLLKDKYNYSVNQISKFDINTASLNICQDIDRVANGEPVNYVIGWQEFLGCKIDLSYKPLIARVETEFWLKYVIDSIQMTNNNISVLDLCCGSGCIGISVLKHISKSFVTFSDISDNAISQTKLNLKINNITPERCTVVKSDLFEYIDTKFDFIFANPPYVDRNGFVPDSLKFEPEIAIFASDNGMEIIKIILGQFDNYLKLSGQLFMEFGYKQEETIKDILINTGKNNINIIQDQYNVNRVLHYRF